MIGDRMKQARRAVGLSLRALAEQAGISAMAISKYENNKSTPSSKVLLALGRALNVRVEYFFRQTNVALKEVEYRKHARLPKRLLAQIEGDIIEQIERFLELAEYLPTRPIETFQVPAGLPKRIDELAQIEVVATQVREAWQLGTNPIPELTDTLEERGILVFQSEALHGERFDGLAANVDGIPIVVVGSGWPGDRQRFTLAHELGHLILKGRLGPALKEQEEAAANRFAGAFLAPESEVKKELGASRTRLEVRELCVLKKAYGLSIGGWQHRARDLGIVSEAAYISMVRFFRLRGWHKNEPCGGVPQEQPQLFLQLVYHALAEDLIGESKAAELLRIPLAEFHAQRNMDSAEHAPHQ
ncbi:MAG: helix-turn-helix domain-containing protein [Gammaproteobacteria bacterium]